MSLSDRFDEPVGARLLTLCDGVLASVLIENDIDHVGSSDSSVWLDHEVVGLSVSASIETTDK